MSLFSSSSKKQTGATSVEEALAGATSPSSAKSKNRKSDKSNSGTEQLVPEKKRARRRLTGAVVMVLAIVIGLPMVLDPEPEAFNKNIAIQIPSGNESTTVSESKSENTEDVAQSESVEQESETSPVAPATETTKESATATSRRNPSLNEAAPTSTTTRSKSDDIPVKKESATKDVGESARALAILTNSDTKTDSGSDSAKTRIVVQAGAFATQAKANELRNKLTSAGIKSYTQKVTTSSGEKIRVRVGPFDDKESAGKVKAQLEKLGIDGSLVSL